MITGRCPFPEVESVYQLFQTELHLLDALRDEMPEPTDKEGGHKKKESLSADSNRFISYDADIN